MTEDHLIGGVEQRSITIVDYDSIWPRVYEAHRARLAKALDAAFVRIEHIGSTAVPGLATKAIVDIQLSITDPNDESVYLPRLEAAGYELRVRERDHRMMRTPTLDVHVHICRIGSDWERRHLLFRDFLRARGEERERYASLKRELAEQDWSDMNAYAHAKGDFINAATARAEVWAWDSRWSPP